MGECYLTFSNPISKQTIHSLVIDVIEYVLFYRGQIPSLLNQNKRQKESKSSKNSSNADNIENSSPVKEFGNVLVYVDESETVTKKNLTRAERLFEESVSKFDSFFQDLSSFLQCHSVLEIVLKLGSTFPNPEIYHIKLPTKCENVECNVDSVPIHRWRSQVYQTLFRSNLASNLIEKPLSISVMVHLLPGDKLASNVEFKRFYKIPKTTKSKLVYFNYHCQHLSEKSEDTFNIALNSSSSTDNALNSSSVWVLIKPELKGIPTKKN